MSTLTPEALKQTLAQVSDPTTGRDLVSLGAVDDIRIDGGKIDVVLVLGYPAAGLQETISGEVWRALKDLPGVDAVSVDIGWLIAGGKASTGSDAIAGVKNIIAVASGKGGVGKSTTAVNLALALAAEGARVGVLDADIYGPSQPQMLGVANRRPEVENNQFMLPVESHGVQSISMGYLVTEQTPMVWRGPMVSGALQQLLTQTRWQDVDYLIVDMPPGTGDIQLTLSQKVPVSGAVIVTTPQDIALLDAKKGIEMFRKVNIPILGVVENMATHICSNCGHQEPIFGAGGGERIAREYDTQLLGSLPLALSIREQADGGNPSVAADPESPVSRQYREIARRMAATLWLQGSRTAGPDIVITDD
ncbi:iron-sulfur cluster carrier protein ApbC [Exilibacterium tricleocarpae]|uniref:Iron-sulfur cluster carrier protein n=1 Tax=Exilibacterium tricleocarpae TaxID=2591008 RepID=A0A545U5I8_9GAMM|nr:iron-sulfur cluster carrier protein ApbC [Exilibacterium tricleocarpae]TQV84727.1 iron-sulfur cluster carrier protein ApbC [Exilibacterium tricleocarpae]